LRQWKGDFKDLRTRKVGSRGSWEKYRRVSGERIPERGKSTRPVGGFPCGKGGGCHTEIKDGIDKSMGRGKVVKRGNNPDQERERIKKRSSGV